jgi:hypothetical protein
MTKTINSILATVWEKELLGKFIKDREKEKVKAIQKICQTRSL